MRILLIILGVCLAGHLFAQGTPDWQVDASRYNYSMVMVGLIKVDGDETSGSGDKVAAFIDGEVRGVASPVFQEQINRNVFYLIIYHNNDGGNVTFRYFDATSNTVTTAAQTAVFSVDALIGDANRPFVFSNRATRSEAELLSYKFPGQLGSRVYQDSVAVRVKIGSDLTTVTPRFTVSDGANLYIDYVRQVSGESSNDFTVPVTLTVRSEDEQHIMTYEVRIREENDEVPGLLFPNGTEQNRTWGISHLGIGEPVKIVVFDQNGQVLFSAADSGQEWDGRYQGKQVPEGVYFYSIERTDGARYQGSLQVIY